jgi:hypothetical protein
VRLGPNPTLSERGLAFALANAMFARTLLPLTTFPSNDHGQLPAALRLARLRTEVAVVRSLADHIERLASPRQVDGVSEQLIEEMARLGRLLSEAAGEVTTAPAQDETEDHQNPGPAMGAT